jgi:hypothetical protein
MVSKFADLVIAESEAAMRGDVDAATRYVADYVAAFKTLRLHGDTGRAALSVLLGHARADVRTTAAAFLLRYCHERARAVLESEAKGEDLLAFEASQTLERWNEGSWSLDPEE